MANSYRIAWLDWAKVTGMFLVVLGHCYPFANPPCYVRNLIYSFHMPLFFFISGMLFKRRSVGESVRKGFMALIVPALCWNAIWILFSRSGGGVTLQFNNFIRGEDIICAPSWFLFALFLCQLLAAVVLNRRTFYFGMVLSLVMWLFCRMLPYCHVGSAAMAFPFFMVGFALKNAFIRCDGAGAVGIAAFGLVVLLASACVFGPISVKSVDFGTFSNATLPCGLNIACFYFIAMCAIVSFLLFVKLFHGIVRKWFENPGTYSMRIANNLDQYAAWCSSGMVVFLCAHRFPRSFLDPYVRYTLPLDTLFGLGVRIVVSLALMLFCSLIYWVILLRSAHLGCLTGFRHGR